MNDEKALVTVHPEGEQQKGEMQPQEAVLSLDTFAGKIQFKWVPDAEVNSLGQMPFFIEFLKTSGLFDCWVDECPRRYTSPNAPQKRMCWGRFCYRCWRGTGGMRTSARCAAMESIQNC